MDRLRELSNAGLLTGDGPSSKPEVHEYDLKVELLAAILAQLQASAQPGERVRAIVPRTAMDVLLWETADADEAVIMAGQTEISDEEYRAWIEDGVIPAAGLAGGDGLDDVFGPS